MKPKSSRVEVEPLRVSRNGKRFFSEAHKQAVVAKCLLPGASVAAVALAHGFNANLVRKWIDKHKRRQAQREGVGTLVPVRVVAASVRPARGRAHTPGAEQADLPDGWIEIELGAVRLIVRGRVDVAQLRAVLEAFGALR